MFLLTIKHLNQLDDITILKKVRFDKLLENLTKKEDLDLLLDIVTDHFTKVIIIFLDE